MKLTKTQKFVDSPFPLEFLELEVELSLYSELVVLEVSVASVVYAGSVETSLSNAGSNKQTV